MADDMDLDMDESEGSLSNPEVVDKYKTAASIANAAILRVVSECRPGVRIVELCALGDQIINEAVSKVYAKDKKLDKGIAFPTCVSPNNVVGHFCPAVDDTSVLQEGDVVKVDLGVQIDGNIAVVGHTAVASANPAQPATGRRADVICAAHFAGEAALRMLRPGKKNHEVTSVIAKVCQSSFAVEGIGLTYLISSIFAMGF
tara:strand:- start:2547 stop:3149 length:603 start_codon:yes stop_codon:yes gene_type:complete